MGTLLSVVGIVKEVEKLLTSRYSLFRNILDRSSPVVMVSIVEIVEVVVGYKHMVL